MQYMFISSARLVEFPKVVKSCKTQLQFLDYSSYYSSSLQLYIRHISRRSRMLQEICNFYSEFIYVEKLFCLYMIIFMFYFILYFHVLFGLYYYIFVKKKTVKSFYFNDLFWLLWVSWKARIIRLRWQNLKQAKFFGRYEKASGFLFQ